MNKPTDQPATARPEQAQKSRIVCVPIDRIQPNPDNPRKTFQSLDSLAVSISTIGLVETPVVVEKAPNSYLLISGERRWRAAKIAGYDNIDVLVRPPSDSRAKEQLHALVANLQREDVNPFELASALTGLKQALPLGTTNRQLARMLGRSEQWLSQIIRLDAMPNAIREQLGNAAVRIPTDILVEIARIEDADIQMSLAKKALKGETVRNFRRKLAHRKHVGGRTRSRPSEYCIKLPRLGSITISTYRQLQTVSEYIDILKRAIVTLSG
jgi:ParB family chromosome partitioning protein